VPILKQQKIIEHDVCQRTLEIGIDLMNRGHIWFILIAGDGDQGTPLGERYAASRKIKE
jgi:hypothetical protein